MGSQPACCSSAGLIFGTRPMLELVDLLFCGEPIIITTYKSVFCAAINVHFWYNNEGLHSSLNYAHKVGWPTWNDMTSLISSTTARTRFKKKSPTCFHIGLSKFIGVLIRSERSPSSTQSAVHFHLQLPVFCQRQGGSYSSAANIVTVRLPV